MSAPANINPPRLGAHVEAGGVRFAAFADAERCEVELVTSDGSVGEKLRLKALGEGYFELLVPEAGPDLLYRFVVDGRRLPDPYARFLPHGVHGPAQVIEPRYRFRHPRPRRPLREQVLYELHVGTFTEEGTFQAARRRLPALAELGITTLELMPVAAFDGVRGWGYDGVALFAPHAAYGTPDQLRELVDAAHGLGLSVLLDVVYNHFGPSGNYLGAYSGRYFHADKASPWGQSPDFSGAVMRNLVLQNARYWLEEMSFDGLRLDATHAIHDTSPTHVLQELSALAHDLNPPAVVIAEDERNLASLVTAEGLDALWADDFHHQLRVTLTGEQRGYFGAYTPSIVGLAEVIQRGWWYTGQLNPVQGEPRGTPAEHLAAEAFVYCIQNHDQIGNRALGERLTASVSRELYLSASLLLLFLPTTPLLFMGQEWGASTPFLYFTDHDPELGRQVSEGRRREFAGFPEFSEPQARERIPDPQAEATFLASKLRWNERELPGHAATLGLYRDALTLRRTDPVLRATGRAELSVDVWGSVLGVHRALGDERRSLFVNLGSAACNLDELAARSQLSAWRRLLQTSAGGARLAPGGAAVIAGRGVLPKPGKAAA
ncbi:MAG TPA: malto-oligosyltrehalose trehalohydrolase [Polyangiaceae bacterium]|nr:malto-oligosyltrehalose trehalohydrolase [Polyangiaceae bacterium]